ncbi:MAG: protein kinase, partial [Candidatus Latescibacteria bacterium]|nr:protein kinase [bacterium]MBD3425452.1 protein kinase [Candidatus Latescibacterota bacterium]
MKRDYQLPARYQKKKLLGSGAAGEVYLVNDNLEKKNTALKIPSNVDEKASETFFNEFRTLSSLDHPGLVKVFDFGVLKENIPYFTMEMVDGEDIKTFLSNNINLSYIPELLEKVISALRYLHKNETLHGDIKPQNIMIIKEGEEIEVKLLDFGLSASAGKVREGISGTPRFLPPEIICDKEYSESSDLYALGMTLVECITGEKVPLYSKISNSFYEEKYRVLSTKLVAAGIGNSYTLSSFILDLCKTNKEVRIESSDKAREKTQTIIREDIKERPALKENILVGREKELKEINSLIDSKEKRGQTLILEGPRGVGKKRLIKEAIK